RPAEDRGEPGIVRSARRWRIADERAGDGAAAGAALFSVLMTIVEHVYRNSDLPDGARAFGRDTVTLGWEDRTHVHGRRHTDGGVEFSTSLPRGTVLRAGDCFVLDAERLIVSIVERGRAGCGGAPRSPRGTGRVRGYHVRRHARLAVTD